MHDINEDSNEELVGCCKQAESVGEKCSRDPVNNCLDIILQVKLNFMKRITKYENTCVGDRLHPLFDTSRQPVDEVVSRGVLA